MNQDPHSKRILFLSGVDFKERSIQVIRKTPESYVKAGWTVHYIVGRDTSKLGDYFYETVINPPGIHIHRFSIPLAQLHGLINNVLWKAVWFRVRNLLLVYQLVIRGIRLLKDTPFEVIYGYEIPGVLAGKIIRKLGFAQNSKFVIRFQGVLYVKEWLRLGQKFRFVSNFEAITALKTPADLCVMTNDGSQGLQVLKKLKAPVRNILFLRNGVDHFKFDGLTLQEVQQTYYCNSAICHFLSVSRLDGHKRLDRGIQIIYELVHKLKCKNLIYTIIGGGADLHKLTTLVESLGLKEHVRFLGPLRHDMVKYFYHFSDFFLSMYTSTNVGNPLLEAIRSNNIIVTLDNGDTGELVSHYKNGLIYPVDDVKDLTTADFLKIAKDILRVIDDRGLQEKLRQGVAETAQLKLWTWEERLQAEVTTVEKLITEEK